MYVPTANLRRAVRLIDDVADVDDPDDFALLAMSGLAEVIGCDVVTYNEIPATGPRVRYVDWPSGALDPATMPIFAAWVHQHPLVNYYRDTGDGQATRLSDFVAVAAWHRLGLYAEFFRPIPIEHQLAITLADPDGTVVGIALNRTGRDFTDDERELLGALRDPLARQLARVNRRRLSRAMAPLPIALTERELEILRLVAAGRTNVAIAHAIGVSPRTVAKHLEHTYRKLGVDSRAAAVARLSRPNAAAAG
jgi:DNA-binding CsgD family transcriptional regulator